MQLTAWQRLRTRLFLFVVGIQRRLTIGARAIVIGDGKVLLLRHTYLPGWHFPGGGVEPGETAATTAARETLEEAGYAVSGPPELLGIYLNRVAGTARDHVVVYVFRGFERRREVSPTFEIAEVRWFALDALPPDIDGGTARRLAELAGEPVARDSVTGFGQGLEIAAAKGNLDLAHLADGANSRFRRQEASKMEKVVHVTRRP